MPAPLPAVVLFIILPPVIFIVPDLRKKENKIIIDESLLTANKSTHVGVHLGQEFIDAGDKIFSLFLLSQILFCFLRFCF